MRSSVVPMRTLLCLAFAARAAALALSPGDTVAVLGASGNVGKLVALRLSETYNVRGVVRNAEKAKSFLGDKVALFEGNARRARNA